MAYSLNKASLIGNLGKDPEIKNTKDGKEIATLVIATSESWKDRNTGEKVEKTEWHKVVIFSEMLVNVVKAKAKKGAKIFIEGALQTRKWTDESGNDRYTTEIVLQNFNSNLILLDKNNAESSDSSYEKDNNFDFGHNEKENTLDQDYSNNTPRSFKQRNDYSKKDRNFSNSDSINNEDMNLDDEIPF